MLRLILKITSLYYITKFALDTGNLLIMGGNIYNRIYPAKPDPRIKKIKYHL